MPINFQCEIIYSCLFYRYCYTSFLDFHRCKKRHSEEYEACKYFKKVYTAMCPLAWVTSWEEQIENGNFQGTI